MNYDPNFVLCGRMAKQDVEITLQSWTAKAKRVVTIGGNCSGLSVLTAAVSQLEDELGENGHVILNKPNGDTLQIDMWDTKLESIVVGVRIIAIRPEKRPVIKASANDRRARG